MPQPNPAVSETLTHEREPLLSAGECCVEALVDPVAVVLPGCELPRTAFRAK